MNRRAFLTAVAVAPVAAAIGVRLATAHQGMRYYVPTTAEFVRQLQDNGLDAMMRPESNTLTSGPMTEEALDLARRNVDKIGNYIQTDDFQYWGETPLKGGK